MVKYGEIAHLETKRLEAQVSQLLKSSILERKPRISKERLSLGPIVDRVVQTLKPVAESADKSIAISGSPAQTRVTGNADMLEMVFYNLLDNAIKYGGREIKVALNTEAGHVVVVVSDNGVGIPEPYRKKIWKKFFRVPTGNVHDVKGFGLGLHMVQNIMKNHRAQISLETGERRSI